MFWFVWFLFGFVLVSSFNRESQRARKASPPSSPEETLVPSVPVVREAGISRWQSWRAGEVWMILNFVHLFSDELLTCCSCCSHPKTSARPREDMRLENWYSEGFWFFLLRFAPSYIEWDCCLVFIRYCNLTFCMWHGLKPSFRTTTPCFSCVSTGVSTLAFGNTTSVYEKWVLLKRLLAGNIPLLEFLESDIPTGAQVVRWTMVM